MPENIVTSHNAKLKWRRFPLLLVNRGNWRLVYYFGVCRQKLLVEEAGYCPFQSDALLFLLCFKSLLKINYFIALINHRGYTKIQFSRDSWSEIDLQKNFFLICQTRKNNYVHGKSTFNLLEKNQ